MGRHRHPDERFSVPSTLKAHGSTISSASAAFRSTPRARDRVVFDFPTVIVVSAGGGYIGNPIFSRLICRRSSNDRHGNGRGSLPGARLTARGRKRWRKPWARRGKLRSGSTFPLARPMRHADRRDRIAATEHPHQEPYVRGIRPSSPSAMAPISGFRSGHWCSSSIPAAHRLVQAARRLRQSVDAKGAGRGVSRPRAAIMAQRSRFATMRLGIKARRSLRAESDLTELSSSHPSLRELVTGEVYAGLWPRAKGGSRRPGRWRYMPMTSRPRPCSAKARSTFELETPDEPEIDTLLVAAAAAG